MAMLELKIQSMFTISPEIHPHAKAQLDLKYGFVMSAAIDKASDCEYLILAILRIERYEEVLLE